MVQSDPEHQARLPSERARRRRGGRLVLGAVVCTVALVAIFVTLVSAGTGSARPNGPTGHPRGVHPGRTKTSLTRMAVVALPDPDAPPPNPNPAVPGVVVESGEDESDPVLDVDSGRYFLYTSGVPGVRWVNVPVSWSTQFGSWSAVIDALPTLPSWVAPGFTWAPDVHQFGNTYVLYFTAMVRGTSPGMECIGDATSALPSGPFTPLPNPFICQSNLGGSIDPRVFVAPNGTDYMLWKSDQNIGGANTPTQMWSQPLAADGLRLVGQPALLLHPDEPWEGTIVEAPDMVEVHGAYWLIYSGNWFNGPHYAIGAARCAGPLGPCLDLPDNPLLGSNLQGQGPGEASVFADSAGVWMLYSPWQSEAPNPDIPPRPVVITRLGFAPSGPYLAAGGPPPALNILPRPF